MFDLPISINAHRHGFFPMARIRQVSPASQAQMERQLSTISVEEMLAGELCCGPRIIWIDDEMDNYG